MRVLRDQVLATTNVDVHGDQIPKDRLREMFEQLPDPWLLANQHDPSLPPMARAVAKRFVQLKSGEWSIQADVEILDEAAFVDKRGYSLAYLRNILSVNPDRRGDLEIRFNPRVFPESEIGELVSLSTDDIQIDARELIEKGVEASVILILKFGTVALFTGFFAKAGADAWETLRDRLKSQAASRLAARGEAVVTFLQFEVSGPNSLVEVVVEVPVRDYLLLEDDISLVRSALLQVEQFSAEAPITKVALRFSRDPNRWVVLYYIGADGQVVATRTDAG